MKHIVVGDDTAVDLRAYHVVADVGVDEVGKVDGRRPGGEVDNVAPGGEDEDLVGEHVHLEIVEKVGGIGFLLALQKPSDPGEGVLVARAQGGVGARTHLVFPVGRDAVLGGVVHLPGADLYLEGDALGADDGGMHTLVHVGLWCGDIILEAAGHGFEHVVDDAQHIIAVGDGVDDDTEGAEIVNAVHVEFLRVHLAVDGVDVLDAAVDGGLYALGLEARLDSRLHAVHEAFELGHALGQILGDLPVALGVEVLQRQVLQLPLGPLHAEAVGDGGIDLHCLEGLGFLLLRALPGHGAHVVQAVGDLDEDDADVLGHGQKHLAQVLRLLVLFAGVLHARQLRDALHDVRHDRTELASDILVGEGGVLDHVMQQRRDDGILIQADIHADVGGGDAVCHIGRAVPALLPGMGHARHVISCADAAQIHVVGILFDFFDKRLKLYVRVLYNDFLFLGVHCVLLTDNCEDCGSDVWPPDPPCR